MFDPVAMMFKQAADLSEILQMGFDDNDQARDYLRMLTHLFYQQVKTWHLQHLCQELVKHLMITKILNSLEQ